MPTDDPTDPDLVLASGSPRRLELLRRLGLAPAVRVSDVIERREPDESPTGYTRRLAEEKARDVARAVASTDLPRWILAADTTVALEDEVLDKPAGSEQARRMLRRLSGSCHEVLTSYCWLDRRERDARTECVSTRVAMRELTDAEIDAYLASGEPFDKAGSYGIQALGGLFVERLEGTYFGVMGLPVADVFRTAVEIGAVEVHPLRDPESLESPPSNRDSNRDERR
ncbi:MAG: nucleoside triphosphate pyrophosphatase [Bradymonadaceae bacterium]